MTNFVAIDVETANSDHCSICQIGGVVFRDGVEIDSFNWLINPWRDFDPTHSDLHGITEEDVRDEPSFVTFHGRLDAILRDKVVVSHGSFDRTALSGACAAAGRPALSCRFVDSTTLARAAWPEVAQRGYGLAALAAKLGIEFQHHDALEDARTAALVTIAAMQELGASSLDAWVVGSQVSSRRQREPLPSINLKLVIGKDGGISLEPA